jgi:hypothetical protein
LFTWQTDDNYKKYRFLFKKNIYFRYSEVSVVKEKYIVD